MPPLTPAAQAVFDAGAARRERMAREFSEQWPDGSMRREAYRRARELHAATDRIVAETQAGHIRRAASSDRKAA